MLQRRWCYMIVWPKFGYVRFGKLFAERRTELRSGSGLRVEREREIAFGSVIFVLERRTLAL